VSMYSMSRIQCVSTSTNVNRILVMRGSNASIYPVASSALDVPMDMRALVVVVSISANVSTSPSLRALNLPSLDA
ncbi:hypothetical protein PMAYCL1PPCAC_27528, partial [Pristionchus mayeri]